MMNLHRISEWESNKPTNIEYQHFFYKPKTLMIRKVLGVIKVTKNLFSTDIGASKAVRCVHKVFWDGYGRCYKTKTKARYRNGDINFNTKDSKTYEENHSTICSE